ncbi:MAG: L-histidine N(alpha)-methyltransferase [Cuniculiplasma sp.]
MSTDRKIKIIDKKPKKSSFKEEILDGLKKKPKRINPKFFYDEEGSKLFEEITETEEYYPTRTERGILEKNIDEICTYFGMGSALFEYGSGGSRKTMIILDHCKQIKAYVPMDISKTALEASAEKLSSRYGYLNVLPICVDYTKPFDIPFLDLEGNIIAIFLGSSIGNFEPETASQFLWNTMKNLGPEDGLLIGVDLKKEISVLERAYNDRKGVTEKFNLNLIDRINREFKINVKKSDFKHMAYYNVEKGRIEMHIEVLQEMDLDLMGTLIHFNQGERIHTENSYKYTREEFVELAKRNALEMIKYWTDEKNYFCIFLFKRSKKDS